MTIEQREEILNKIENMSKKEINAIIVKACEGTGLTFEDFISTDWGEVFTIYKRKHNKKPDFTNHIGNALDYPN